MKHPLCFASTYNRVLRWTPRSVRLSVLKFPPLNCLKPPPLYAACPAGKSYSHLNLAMEGQRQAADMKAQWTKRCIPVTSEEIMLLKDYCPLHLQLLLACCSRKCSNQTTIPFSYLHIPSPLHMYMHKLLFRHTHRMGSMQGVCVCAQTGNGQDMLTSHSMRCCVCGVHLASLPLPLTLDVVLHYRNTRLAPQWRLDR